MTEKPATSPEISIVKPSFLDKYKSKRPPTIGGVDAELNPLKVLRIGEVGDFARFHPNEDEYWTPELCFVSVPVNGEKRDMLHLIDEDIAVQVPAGEEDQAACGWRWRRSRTTSSSSASCRRRTSTIRGTSRRSRLVQKAKTPWVQALSRKAEGVDAYKIEYRPRPGRLPGSEMADAHA